jgi:hypothetical protein
VLRLRWFALVRAGSRWFALVRAGSRWFALDELLDPGVRRPLARILGAGVGCRSAGGSSVIQLEKAPDSWRHGPLRRHRVLGTE